MPYNAVTLNDFVETISDLQDDPAQRYWTPAEITLATYEALLVWGALTSFWRTRGAFPITPALSPYYDLSSVLPALRTRSWTMNQMVQDLQFALLENPSGVSGTGMSGQVDVESITNAIQVAHNRFLVDAHLPLNVHTTFASPPPPDGMVAFDQHSVYVHRASWQDVASGAWNNLWREDAWSVDKANQLWTLQPGSPLEYSEAENAPLKLQLIPPPVNEGVMDALTVDSAILDVTNPNATFGIPDEWIHAVKYGALSFLLSGESQIKDAMRADYAEKRYQQAADFAKDARSVIRLLVDGVPLPLDSLAAVDAGDPYWRNRPGRPQTAGAVYDMVVISPGVPDRQYGCTADVVQSAPLPFGPGYIQLGAEELDAITGYVIHILSFKCGGTDFKSGWGDYDSFMQAVARRKSINAAKIRYLRPLFGQPQAEWALRPDKVEVSK